MFGFKSCRKCKEEIPQTFEEFVLKRENDRIKLHIRYISSIAVAIIVWLIATGTANNDQFSSWVSFAGTITSIILSVLAIIMSITGEGKTEHIKDRLEDTAKKINTSQTVIDEINKQIERNLGQFTEEVKRLSSKVDEVPHKTAQKVNEYQNEKMRNAASKKNINTRVSARSWEDSTK